MINLMGHHKNPENHQVRVDYQLEAGKFYFQAQYRGEFHINSAFKTKSYDNFGLWEYDVVELFLTRESSLLPYIEIQVSPLDQRFSLKIDRPREVTSAWLPNTFEVKSDFDGVQWLVEGSLYASDIPGSEDVLMGNIHSCLGPSQNRSYYGLKINPEDIPDFHRPDLFKQLGRL